MPFQHKPGWLARFWPLVYSLSTAALFTTLVSCDTADHDGTAEQAHLSELGATGSRVYQRVVWDTLFSIGGSLNDTLLLNPRILATRDGLLYAYDYYDSRLKAFDAAGRLRWTFGREGEGPGEFVNPTNLEVAEDSAVWITDGGLGRFQVVSSDGQLQRVIPFPEGRTYKDVVPVGRKVIATVISGAPFWISMSPEGEVVGSGDFPNDELRQANPIARQTLIAAADQGGKWATIFPMGDLLLVYQGTELHCTGRLIEGEPFPEQFRPLFWAVAIEMSDTSIYVLAKGRTDEAQRIVDEYSAEDCSYQRTLPLPRKFMAMTYDRGRFYLAYEDPAPTILALHPILQ